MQKISYACDSLVSNEFQLTIGSEAVEKLEGKNVVLPLVSKSEGRLHPVPHCLFHPWQMQTAIAHAPELSRPTAISWRQQ